MTDLAEHIAHLGMSEKQDDQAEILPDLQQEQPALPEGGTFDQGDQLLDSGSTGDEQKTQTQEEEIDWKAKFEESEKASNGRLADLQSTRTKLSEQSDNIEQLRQLYVAQQEQAAQDQQYWDEQDQLAQEEAHYGEAVVNDPHVAYMRDQVAQVRYDMEAQAQEREGRARQIQEQASTQRNEAQRRNNVLFQVKTQEAEFAKEHEDYNDAYQFARNKRAEMYARRGYAPEQVQQLVGQDEIYLMEEQLARGGNIAQEIYSWAKDFGWQATGKAAKSNPAQQAADQSSDFDKIRAGLSQQGMRSMGGDGNSNKGDQFMSREQFYTTVPEHIRAMVHANEDQFEELARTGKIRVTW